MNYFRTSDMGALADMSGNPAHFTADELNWPNIERKPTILHRKGRETLILPVTNSMPLDVELAPVSTPAKHVAAPIATAADKAALWGSAHRSHVASMPRNNRVNESGHRAVPWVAGGILAVGVAAYIIRTYVGV